MSYNKRLQSTFFLERYKGNGILQLKTSDEYFPIDMGDDNYVVVLIRDIDKGKNDAKEIIKSFDYVFNLKNNVTAEILYAIINKKIDTLDKKYRFSSELHGIISMRVVLFYMLGLEKEGDAINLKNFVRLKQFLEEKVYPENIYQSDISIFDRLLKFSPMNFYEEKSERFIRFLRMEQAIGMNIILPMAEIIRVALTEGMLFFLGLEVAAWIFRGFEGLIAIYELFKTFEALESLQWLLKIVEWLFSKLFSFIKLLMNLAGVKDFYDKAKTFFSLFDQFVSGLMQVFMFQDYTIQHNILWLDGCDSFSDEDDEIIFQTAKEYS